MPRIKFENKVFRASSVEMIERALVIIDEYEQLGFRLTLRQLYYQFVSRNWLANKQSEYKRLGSLMTDARLAGIVDWNAIEDRARNLQTFPSWNDPASIVGVCSDAFALDLWKSQPNYIEVWVEKEALIGVLARPCGKWRVNHFACKGYTSASEMWDGGWNRLRGKKREGKDTTIIHLGDHDPSGIDMTRDIQDRINLFAGGSVEILRIALNMDQVEEYNPPPNPAKMTDSRFEGYVDRFGEESWELDALPPNTIADLIEKEILERLDLELWEREMQEEWEGKETLRQMSNNFGAIQGFLNPDESVTEGWIFE